MQEVEHPFTAPKRHFSRPANSPMLTLAWKTKRDAQDLLTSFLAIFGVVFLNFEVLKRFMLLSQTDFTAFRVSGRGLSLQLTVERGRAVSARFALRSLPVELENVLGEQNRLQNTRF